jgi:signal transduction histidine kinase/ActR/RegA family two-component response regulator
LRAGATLNIKVKTAQIDRRGTLGWLRAVMVLAALLPALAFVGAAVFLHRQALSDARLQVDRAARIAEEHALKVFETNVALLNRAIDLLGNETDAALLAREPQLHRELKRLAANLPQLQGLFIIDATGHMLVTNRMLPAPHTIDYADRDFFRHHRDGGTPPYISALLTSRATGEPFFDMSLRRTHADGSFGGTLSASMAPAYFARFYAGLADADDELHVSLVRDDGAVLVRWPQPPAASDAKAASGIGVAAMLAMRGNAPDVLATRQLTAYPLHVTAWMQRDAVLAPWFHQISILAALMFPTAIGLFCIAWVAQRKTRDALTAAEALRHETVQREQVEEALRQAQKLEAMGRLTGGVAHDFNNLLTIVSNNVYLLKRQEPELSDSSALAAIGRAVTSGSNLTRQLLSFSRRQPLHPETIDLRERMPVVAELLRTAVGGAVRVVTVIDPATASIDADVAELELALLNLAINARDAMPQGGELRLEIANAGADDRVGRREPRVAITLRDTGQGIAAELLERVFEPFFTTKPVGKGTGLGLSQVYGFCTRAGGTIALESRPGQGTVVRMSFPAASGAAQASPDRQEASSNGLQGLRVLLVEDNDDVASATGALLQSMGAAVHRMAGAEAARRHLRTHAGDFDVLLSDIVMPGSFDGIQLAGAVQRDHPGLAVLLMSGYSDFIDEAAELQLEILSKPCAAATLAAAIHNRVVLARGSARKKRTISADAFGPDPSV